MAVRILRIALFVLALLVVTVIGLLAWAIGTQSGARRVADIAEGVLDGRLQVRQIEGKLAGPLVLHDVRYRDEARGVLFEAGRLLVDPVLRDLLRLRVHVRDAQLSDVLLHMQQREPQPPSEPREFSLEPPVEIVIDRFSLDDMLVQRDDKKLVQIDRALLAGSWTAGGLSVRQLEVHSPQGEVELHGRLDKERVYIGEADARFRWQFGERTFAGTLQVTSEQDGTALQAHLSSPFPVHADASLQQADEALLIDALRVTSDDLPGTLYASGQLDLGADAPRAALKARWEDVVLPKELAGEQLATHGTIEVSGVLESYTASGDLSIGPPGRLSDINLKLQGTQESITLQQLTVVQPLGRLAATGEIRISPDVGWRIKAEARRFDPGAILPPWKGELTFSLDTEGKLTDDGPHAELQLASLEGHLRGRPVAGTADLTLRPALQIAGTLQLRSGSSSIRLTGEQRARQSQVSAVFDIASLDDWLPGASGQIRGNIQASGTWPKVAINGRVRARRVNASGASVDRLTLVADISSLDPPAGTVDADARGVSVGGIHWNRVTAQANGDPKAHMLGIDATGEPVSIGGVVRGAWDEKIWTGELSELALTVPHAGKLALQAPAPLSVGKEIARLGDTCLIGDRMQICLAGERGAEGVLQASYDIRNLPLDLLTAAAGDAAPVEAHGAIDGTGRIRREADGTMFGNAALSSASGRFFLKEDDESPLLTYRDLLVEANLEGDAAQIRVGGTLGETGELQGSLRMTGLQESPITLQGNARLSLDDLKAVELFTPRVAQVSGRLQADATVTGTTDAPLVAARARLVDAGVELPDLGIRLRDGQILLSREADGALTLEGSVASGDGQVALRGGQIQDGTLQLQVQGKRFLAADLPGARVEVSPELTVRRAPERISIEGTVTVPQARVDLQRLPRTRAPSVSPDVIVVDDPQPDEQRDALPIYANVTVILGKDVRLIGYGLDAALAGRLVVREEPDAPTTGSGEIQVTGTYKAYGQDLQIDQGSLFFASTPIDNPRLNISAFRDVDDDVRPGLRITGTARNPQLTVTSDPALPEAEALSYLVTGKPLRSVGAEEGDIVQSAARSLGTAAGNLLARNVGRRLGLDEISIGESEALGGESAFTIGEYLSPRLFLSYGVGLFTPGQVVTLRYRISDEVRVEASNTSVETRAAISYEVQR